MARSIEVPGLLHGGNPIPAAARRGPFLVTGGVSGIDRETGTRPDDAAEQVRNMFANLGAILDAGGAALADVVHISVALADNSARAALNEEWLKVFPDKTARPARHVTVTALPGGMAVQLHAQAFVTGENNV